MNWNKVRKTIGRFTRTDESGETVTYSLTSELKYLYAITSFTVDFEDKTYTNIERQEIIAFNKDIEYSTLPFTKEEIKEIEEMIKEVTE